MRPLGKKRAGEGGIMFTGTPVEVYEPVGALTSKPYQRNRGLGAQARPFPRRHASPQALRSLPVGRSERAVPSAGDWGGWRLCSHWKRP